MEFIKNFFNHDKVIVGLCSLKRTKEYVKITLPKSYKKTFITNTEHNFLLF